MDETLFNQRVELVAAYATANAACDEERANCVTAKTAIAAFDESHPEIFDEMKADANAARVVEQAATRAAAVEGGEA